jgi:hypothetical protein
MHRTLQITVSPSITDELCGKLTDLENVITVSVVRGESLKPVGDVITVQVLNRGADEALRCVGEAAKGKEFSVAALARFGLDALFIIGGGIVVFWLKQILVHRRKPLV